VNIFGIHHKDRSMLSSAVTDVDFINRTKQITMVRAQHTDCKCCSSPSTAPCWLCSSGHQIANGLYTQLSLLNLKTMTVSFYKPSHVTVISTHVEERSWLNHENKTGRQKRLWKILQPLRYLYIETNVMHFLLNVLRINGLYMFRALLALPQEALHSRDLVYCVRVTS
jgi:hypothetical protein